MAAGWVDCHHPCSVLLCGSRRACALMMWISSSTTARALWAWKTTLPTAMPILCSRCDTGGQPEHDLHAGACANACTVHHGACETQSRCRPITICMGMESDCHEL